MAIILVAEDDRHIMRVISLWLTRNGHTVRESADGVEALGQLRAGGIDLMICDINMPGMSGLQVLEVASREDVLPGGVIILSSRCDQKEIERQIAAYGGAVHPKPFSPSRLIRLVEESLAGRAVAPTAAIGTSCND
ncbi:MAG TPA: response regulator [Phycisphaerae bacterium]|nr:response regulator [Phycisphaerae bacterium]